MFSVSTVPGIKSFSAQTVLGDWQLDHFQGLDGHETSNHQAQNSVFYTATGKQKQKFMTCRNPVTYSAALNQFTFGFWVPFWRNLAMVVQLIVPNCNDNTFWICYNSDFPVEADAEAHGIIFRAICHTKALEKNIISENLNWNQWKWWPQDKPIVLNYPADTSVFMLRTTEATIKRKKKHFHN